VGRGKCKLGLVNWNPANLKVGDLLQLRVTSRGEIEVLVNWTQQVLHKVHIPLNTQLFALVDLQGCTSGVSFLTHEELELSRVGARAQVPWATMRGFSRTMVGRSILMSPDALAATRKGGAVAGSECVLMGDGPMEVYADKTSFFALLVTAASKGSEEGLLVGFTTRSPAELGQAPLRADQVDPCWLVGCDGACWNGNTQHWEYSDWDPRDLAVGDIVLVSVTSEGDLCVSINGTLRASHRMHIPVSDGGLFALVDLLGCAVGVALASQESIAMVGSVGDGTSVRPKAAPPSIAPSMCRFHHAANGGSLTLSKDQRSATRAAKLGASWAVLLGDAPLERAADGGTSFMISITGVCRNFTEGLAVGVTTRPPGDIVEIPETADALKPSWLVGYDGATWNGSVWGLSDWRPQQLRVGDTVAVSTSQGQLKVSVNGAFACSHDLGIPEDMPLFALLDLACHIAGVTLLQPPPAEGRSGQALPPNRGGRAASSTSKPPQPGSSSRLRSPEATKGLKEDRAPRERKDPKQPREPKLPKERKRNKEQREPKEPRGPRERRDRRERQKPPE